jgi:hypothetical protein
MGWVYVYHYTPKKNKVSNRLLVIGFLRKFFGFRFFFYFKI